MKHETQQPIANGLVSSENEREQIESEARPSIEAQFVASPAAADAVGAFTPAAVPDQSIVSIPQSLREQLQRVQLLLNQSEHAKTNGRDEIAQAKAEQAVSVMNNLINRSTESATLAILADMGCQGFQFGTVEEVEHFTILEKRAFGMSFGQEVVPTKKIIRRNSQGRVF